MNDAEPRPCAICLKAEIHDYRYDHEYRPTPRGTYTPYYIVHAEGARVGLTTCLRCGATVIVGDADGAISLHDAWHARHP